MDHNQSFDKEPEITNIYPITNCTGYFQVVGLPKERSSLYFYSKEFSHNLRANKLQELSSIHSRFILDSSTKLWIIFDNSEKRFNIGRLLSNSKFKSGSPISVYSRVIEGEKIESILSLDIISYNEDIIFITQNHVVMVLSHLSKKIQIAKRSINEGGDRLVIQYLKPSNPDEKYVEIKSNISGKLFFLRSQTQIDIFDLNYECLKKVDIDPIEFRGFACFIDAGKDFFLVWNKKDLKLSRIRGIESSKELCFHADSDIADNEERGNPIVDYVWLSKKKFGSSPFFIGSALYHKIVLNISKKEKRFLEEYMNSIGLEKIKLERKIDWEDIEIKEGSNIVNILGSRVPIHLATIENFTLTPLRDGKNFSEEIAKTFEESSNKTNIIEYLVSMIRFGNYEELLKSWTGDVFVVSIIGRQSSGKSYMLNRLFGTRFNVAANRCTDGIWMSCTIFESEEFKKKLVIVLDCEGLFSIRRNNQEEMKMCLALSSISDILILNQDLSFNRNLVGIFENMQKIIGRLRGKNLFKGLLFTLIRDVPHSNTDEAYKEFTSFIKSVYEKENNFITKLFEGKSACMCIVNFENGKFIEYLKKMRQKHIFSMVNKRWKTPIDFLSVFKIMLAQVMTDDDTDIDEYKLRIEIEKIKKECFKLFFGSNEESIIYPKSFKFSAIFEGKNYDFEFKHEDLMILFFQDEIKENANYDSTTSKMIMETEEKDSKIESVDEMNHIGDLGINSCSKLINKFEESFTNRTDANHSEWYKILKKMIKLFLKERRQICLDAFENLSKSISNEEEKKKLLHSLEMVFKLVSNDSLFCERSCRTCDRECVLLKNHKVNCNCLTNHRCSHTCEILEECKKENNLW